MKSKSVFSKNYILIILFLMVFVCSLIACSSCSRREELVNVPQVILVFNLNSPLDLTFGLEKHKFKEDFSLLFSTYQTKDAFTQIIPKIIFIRRDLNKKSIIDVLKIVKEKKLVDPSPININNFLKINFFNSDIWLKDTIIWQRSVSNYYFDNFDKQTSQYTFLFLKECQQEKIAGIKCFSFDNIYLLRDTIEKIIKNRYFEEKIEFNIFCFSITNDNIDNCSRLLSDKRRLQQMLNIWQEQIKKLNNISPKTPALIEEINNIKRNIQNCLERISIINQNLNIFNCKDTV